MLPKDLSKLATFEISAKDATTILRDMGYDIPSKASIDELTRICKDLDTMSDTDIAEFMKRVKTACK